MQNGTMSELYTDDKKSKYSRNPNHILKAAKNFYEKLYIKETIAKFLVKGKSQINNFTIVREKLF